MHEMLLSIQHEGTTYLPLIKDSVKVNWELSGSPGKLTFELYNDKNISFQEGDKVRFAYDGVNVFCGYVFIKSRDKKQVIQVTAYDQLRYLKNKDTLHFYDTTASDAIQNIAKACGLEIGEFEDTKALIDHRGDNSTYFDMIEEMLKQTLQATKKKYVLYDDNGRLTLKSTDTMKLDTLFSGHNIENFSYETSIDGETYNQIVLFYDTEDKGRELFIAEDQKNIEKWGLLRCFESAKSVATAQSTADTILELYNRKRRKLKVSGVFGDVRVRAGAMVPVALTLGDVNAEMDYLRVDAVTHTFQTGVHTMDLELWGGMFV